MYKILIINLDDKIIKLHLNNNLEEINCFKQIMNLIKS